MLSEANKIKALEEELARTKEEFSRFVYVASHDLNEPLRKVLSFGDMLKSKYSSSIDSKGQDYIERMQSSSRRMQILLNDLLQYSRTETLKDHFEEINLGLLLDKVKNKLKANYGDAVDTIKAEGLTNIEANPVFIGQLLEQILSNALLYQAIPNQARVSIKVETLTNLCRINFIDNGIGFEAEHHEKVFLPFHRLHGKSSNYPGSGLGLAICRRIVERHSGSINIKSTVGEGTTVSISLPIKQN
jgi:light-regulated signal transduction histidine kinase (bacteriophytochrome)